MKKVITTLSLCMLAALLMLCVPASGQGNPEKAFEGDWAGLLEIHGVSRLNIVFHLRRDETGALEATMDSPDQKAYSLPALIQSIEGNRIVLTVLEGKASFSGALSTDGTEIAGEWLQAGAALPLTVKKGAKVVRLRRSQDPVKPWPYEAEDVYFTNLEDNVGLAGTLTFPKDGKPHPAILLVTGSGPQDRNEEVFNHRPFLVLADYLTRRGFVVLRYDDRGVGGSSGDFAKATTYDFAKDAQAGLEFLKTRPEVKAGSIGLLGHSEGALVASIVASRTKNAAFVVLMAGPGVKGDAIIMRQVERILQASQAPREEIDRKLALQRKILDIVMIEPDRTAAAAKLRKCLAEAGAGDPSMIRQVDQQIDALLSPWYRTFLKLDPAESLKKVKCPVLALNGEKDCQVDPAQNLPAIEKALKAGGNSRVAACALPGLNHLFQTAKTGLVTEYIDLDETISPAALTALGEWLAKTAR